jgi:hypothetical protein
MGKVVFSPSKRKVHMRDHPKHGLPVCLRPARAGRLCRKLADHRGGGEPREMH